MRFTSILGGVGMSLAAFAAAAAPATPDEAQSIKGALERYVGRGEDGSASPVTVTPSGDGYAIAIDVKRALRGLESFGVTIEPASYSLVATPQDGGTWHVTSAGLPRVTVKYGSDSYSVVMNGTSFDGVYDTRLPGFANSALSYDGMSIAAIDAKGGTQTRQINRGKQNSTATAAGDGIADVHLTQSSEGFSQDLLIDPAGKGEARASDQISVKSAGTSGAIAIDALHTRAVADLWAFFVAHPSKDALKAAQDDLRGLLRQALPLFDRLTQDGSTEGLAVESPYGRFALKSVGGRLKVNGLVAQGQVESDLRFDGLEIPGGLLPSWGDGLVPVSADLKQSFSGFHLDQAARTAIDSFDLNAKVPLTPAVIESMRVSLGPLDQMTLVVAPSQVLSKLLDVHIEGTVHFRLPTPDLHLTLRASGLDKAIQDVQSRSAGDKLAAQLIGGLILAKGLGKAESDGSLTWAVATNEAGQITVNGLAMPGN